MSGSTTTWRADLLELTPEALTALANAGFVKRAQKDVAAGLLPKMETGADGVVQAHFDDGVRTSLPPGRTLRDAQCSCPASGMCRHRVMLVLAYQAQAASAKADAPDTPDEASAEPDGAWSPAQFDDAALAASLAPSVLEQANKLAAARPVVGVQAWRSASAPPVARLPMCSVRFFSRSSLVHARCDCKQGSGCAHVVIAVWAFRQAGSLAPGSAEVMVEVQPSASAGVDTTEPAPLPSAMQGEAALAVRAQIDALLLSLWLDGSSQPLMALAARFEAVRSQVRALGWNWIDDALDELWQLLQAQQARSSRFEPLRLVRVLTELWARLQAAAHAGRPQDGSARPALPASQILGIGVKGEVALDHLRLVSLGAELWSDETAEGANILFADPDTQNVTVLERQWSREADAAAGGAGAQPAEPTCRGLSAAATGERTGHHQDRDAARQRAGRHHGRRAADRRTAAVAEVVGRPGRAAATGQRGGAGGASERGPARFRPAAAGCERRDRLVPQGSCMWWRSNAWRWRLVTGMRRRRCCMRGLDRRRRTRRTKPSPKTHGCIWRCRIARPHLARSMRWHARSPASTARCAPWRARCICKAARQSCSL